MKNYLLAAIMFIVARAFTLHGQTVLPSTYVNIGVTPASLGLLGINGVVAQDGDEYQIIPATVSTTSSTLVFQFDLYVKVVDDYGYIGFTFELPKQTSPIVNQSFEMPLTDTANLASTVPNLFLYHYQKDADGNVTWMDYMPSASATLQIDSAEWTGSTVTNFYGHLAYDEGIKYINPFLPVDVTQYVAFHYDALAPEPSIPEPGTTSALLGIGTLVAVVGLRKVSNPRNAGTLD